MFDATANILGRWLAGQLVVMATVGILSGLGLWALGIEAALVLGLVGGVLLIRALCRGGDHCGAGDALRVGPGPLITPLP